MNRLFELWVNAWQLLFKLYTKCLSLGKSDRILPFDFHYLHVELAFYSLSELKFLLLHSVVKLLVCKQAVLKIKGENRLNRSQIYLGFISLPTRIIVLDALVDHLFNPFLFFYVPFFNQIFEEFTKPVVAYQIAIMEFMVADRALVLAINYLWYASFTKSVAALSNIRIIVCLEADNTLCELADYVVDTDFYSLIVLRTSFLESGRGTNRDLGLINICIYHSD